MISLYIQILDMRDQLQTLGLRYDEAAENQRVRTMRLLEGRMEEVEAELARLEKVWNTVEMLCAK